MKIIGSKNYVKFDFENGYVIKAEGEMLLINGEKSIGSGEEIILNNRKV